MYGASVDSGTDWFGRAVDRAIKQDAKVPEVAKELDKSGMAFTKLGGMRNLGDSRAKRDLYYAWLMARAARRTPQIILKKTLASASFDGAEMPRTVFTSSGGSGVAVRSDEIQLDMTNVQKYLDQDKDCQSALSRTAKELPKQDDLDSQIAALPGAFPATCGARSDSTYPTILQSIDSSCQQMKAAYEHARVGCSSMSINVQDSQCQSVTLGNYYSAFEAYCTKEKDKCAQLEDAEERAKCEKSADNLKSDEEFYDPADPKVKYKKSELDGEGGAVATTFYNQDGNFNTDYFPGVDWKHSLWIDPNAGK